MIRRVIINHIDPEFVESYKEASKDLLAALKEKEGLLEGCPGSGVLKATRPMC